MFRNPSRPENEHSFVRQAFMNRWNQALREPIVPSSDDSLDNYWQIINVCPELKSGMTGNITKQMIKGMDGTISKPTLDMCEMVILSPLLDSLISTLELTAQKIQMLNLKKLSALLILPLTTPKQNQYSVESASVEQIACLFKKLNRFGVSFEMLASMEDRKFELLVFGANQLLALCNQNLPLTKLPELSYLQIWALTRPAKTDEHELISTNREQAIDCLNNLCLSNQL